MKPPKLFGSFAAQRILPELQDDVGPRRRFVIGAPLNRLGGAILAMPIALLLVLFVYQSATRNYHTVIDGELYRSAQLSAGDIERYVKRDHIRSIINLRGENAGAQWYIDELKASHALNVAHFDFRMSARRVVSQQYAEELIHLMERAPKPLLIHCTSGADRTSLAAALYLAKISKAGEVSAEQQLGIYYGHYALPFLPIYAMTQSFENLEPWLGYPKS